MGPSGEKLNNKPANMDNTGGENISLNFVALECICTGISFVNSLSLITI